TASPNIGYEGDTVTLNYRVANVAFFNHLDLQLDLESDNGEIACEDTAGSGSETYTISDEDAIDGVITITAIFIHANTPMTPVTIT
ncbi:hypothetical protein, partial [Treponema sp. R6D11]